MAKNDYAVAPSSWIDSLDTTVSIACAIQCSVFPLLVGVLPLLGWVFFWVKVSRKSLSRLQSF